MKNIIIVACLALLGYGQVSAQRVETKATPDLPIVQVTLSVTNNGNGMDSIVINKGDVSGTTFDSLLIKQTTKGEITTKGTLCRSNKNRVSCQ